MRTRRFLLGAAVAVVTGFAGAAFAQETSIVVASTTSTQDSGLFGYLLPLFKAKAGIDVKVVAQGTGQALDTARRGDADVMFVHAKAAEEKFLAEGFGVKRFPVMYNDFIMIGPVLIRPSLPFGRRPASTSPGTRAPGIARSARAWAPPSTRRAP